MTSSIKIGFIGAGHVGRSLSHYFFTHHLAISGFLAAPHGDPLTASQAVNATPHLTFQQLALASDWIFLTVPDDQIASVANQLAPFLTKRHVLFHCSGAQPSALLRQVDTPVYQYCSLHPAAVFADDQTALDKILFTIEGPATTVDQVKTALSTLPNQIQPIDDQQKAKYHAACVFSSNFINALLATSQTLFQQVGLDSQFATRLSLSLAQQQLDQIQARGLTQALTGPVKRGDLTTIQRHLASLDPSTAQLYQLLSLTLLHTGAVDLPSEKTNLINQELHNEKYRKDIPRL